MPEPRPLRVFLCHAKEDKPAIRNLYAFLKKQPWIEPWLDEVNLLPGMDWEIEIFKALRDADAILVCLSKESVAKEGYVQKEFKRALGFAEEKPEGAIYIIPLRLDDCKPPLKFQQWQWADYFQPDAQKKLLQSLYLRAGSLKILPPPAKPASKPPTAASSVNLPTPVPVAPASAKTTPGGHPIYVFGGLEFVKIPAGDFYMGSNDDFSLDKISNSSSSVSVDDDIIPDWMRKAGWGGEESLGNSSKPQHLVYQLNFDYYITRFPVTNYQYSLMTRETGGSIIMAKGKAQHPVVQVSWYDAQIFTIWLNKKHQADLPKGYHFCLPSEAEWEKAARGTDGNEYPWGDKFDENKCNTSEGGKGDTTPVGTYSPQGDSPFGCADMAGNVWEWTRSLWGDNHLQPLFKYPYRFDDNREDENAGDSIYRVLRGGTYSENRESACCAARNIGVPQARFENLGFRVAISLAPHRLDSDAAI